MIKIPAYLKKGDTIGITCPAGFMEKSKAQTCIETLQQWGFKVVVGNTLGGDSTTYFSGTDEQRLQDLQSMLDDDNINAILCGRGGYGMSRIIDRISFKKFKRRPKWIIGFSDITVLHAHIFSSHKIASIHAPMAAAFNDGGAENEFVLSLKKMLVGKKNSYTCATHAFNQEGLATATLVGGNLSLLVHCIGTPSQLNTTNKILFIEDIGELKYSTDRMLQQLKRSGALKGLAGLIIGGFTDVKDTERPFGKSIEELIVEVVEEYDYPICFQFPVSHEKENYALKIGGTYTLKVGKNTVKLSEK